MANSIREDLKNKESNFEEGVERILGEIERLLIEKKYVAIVIDGPHPDETNVGKTYLGGSLLKALATKGIPCQRLGDMYGITHNLLSGLKWQQNQYNHPGGVFIFDGGFAIPFSGNELAQAGRKRMDEILSQKGKEAEIEIPKVDLYVLLYRPDKLFKPGQDRFADIIIRNDAAKDKD